MLSSEIDLHQVSQSEDRTDEYICNLPGKCDVEERANSSQKAKIIGRLNDVQVIAAVIFSFLANFLFDSETL